MKTFGTILFTLALTGLAAVTAAHAQTMNAECYERANLLHALAIEHGERLAQTRRVRRATAHGLSSTATTIR
jgi:hypothetical protein